MTQLADKTVAVTGASRGIGRAIAKGCAEAGANVVVMYQSGQDLANEVVAEITALGKKAIAVQVSIQDRSSIEAAIAVCENTFGPIDVLVNNAAIAQEKPFLTITDEDWDQMLGVNLRGAFTFSQLVLPTMIERGWGRIINISSIGGQWGGFNQVHYAASKAALISLTQSLAKIFSSDGVTTNAIAPGLVATDMAAEELDSAAGKQKVANIPAGRIGKSEEVASAVVYLASDEAAYVTGQTLNLNGGMYFS